MKQLFVMAMIICSTWASATDNIIGGEDARIEDWPFMVSVNKQCGGSLIHPQWVMTVAHCSQYFQKIFIGSHHLYSSNMVQYEIEKAFIHPDYGDGEEGHDIALLNLKRPIDLQAGAIYPVRLADAQFEARGHQSPGTLATVLGWGLTTYDSDQYPVPWPYLQRVDIPIVSNEIANAPDSYNGEVKENMLAAGLEEGGKDACQHDSGGPLVVRDPETRELVQVGIVAWGIGCALPLKYGIYTRVSHYAEWVRSTLNAENQNLPRAIR